MRAIAWALCVMLLVAGGACHNTREDSGDSARAGTSGKTSAAGREITGTVRYVDLEGGFYGIVADDGAKLDPVNLPAEFQKDGLRIRAYVEELRDRVSVRMWGTLVRIRALERLRQDR